MEASNLLCAKCNNLLSTSIGVARDKKQHLYVFTNDLALLIEVTEARHTSRHCSSCGAAVFDILEGEEHPFGAHSANTLVQQDDTCTITRDWKKSDVVQALFSPKKKVLPPKHASNKKNKRQDPSNHDHTAATTTTTTVVLKPSKTKQEKIQQQPTVQQPTSAITLICGKCNNVLATTIGMAQSKQKSFSYVYTDVLSQVVFGSDKTGAPAFMCAACKFQVGDVMQGEDHIFSAHALNTRIIDGQSPEPIVTKDWRKSEAAAQLKKQPKPTNDKKSTGKKPNQSNNAPTTTTTTTLPDEKRLPAPLKMQGPKRVEQQHKPATTTTTTIPLDKPHKLVPKPQPATVAQIAAPTVQPVTQFQRPARATPVARLPSNDDKKEECEYFTNNGWCLSDDRCKKIHGKPTFQRLFPISHYVSKWAENPKVLAAPAFDKIINYEGLKAAEVELILTALTSFELNHGAIQKQAIKEAFKKLLKSELMQVTIPIMLSKYFKLAHQLKLVIKFFTVMMTHVPEKAISVRIEDVGLASVALGDASLIQEVKQLTERKQRLVTSNFDSTHASDVTSDGTMNELLNIPTVPTFADFTKATIPPKNVLHPNQFKNMRHILDTHFKLLREDFMEPLREGFLGMQKAIASSTNFRFTDLAMFTHVKITNMSLIKWQFTSQIFITFKAPMKIDWKISKLLQHGNLVCLFPTPTISENTPINKQTYGTIVGDIIQAQANPIICTIAERPGFGESQHFSITPYSTDDMKKLIEHHSSYFVMFERFVHIYL